MTFLECYVLLPDDIDVVLPAFPDFARLLRKRAIHFAVRRAFIMSANIKKSILDSAVRSIAHRSGASRRGALPPLVRCS